MLPALTPLRCLAMVPGASPRLSWHRDRGVAGFRQEPLLGGVMGSIGETLRQARIDKGVSIADAERATYIRRRYLEALEADDYAALPASVYTRGFIRTYAEYLGLD